MRKILKITFIMFLLLLIAFNGKAFAGYGDWDAQDEAISPGQLEEIIIGMEEAVNKAVESNAAHPAFIEDLENHIEELRLLLNKDETVTEWGDYPTVAEDYEEITTISSLRGDGFTEKGDGSWILNGSNPSLAIWEGRTFSSIIIEADVTFLEGGIEFNTGLYNEDEDVFVNGGLGPHGSKVYIGSGTFRSPGREWNEREGEWRESLKRNQPYQVRVEIKQLPGGTQVELYLDGEKYLSHMEETQLEEGYIAFRTWTNEVKLENVRIYDF